MKKMLFFQALFSFIFFGCQKQDTSLIENIVITDSSSLVPFTRYTIRQGQQFCDENTFAVVEYTVLKFVVKFDSSALYRTTDPSNQFDINKLYGFADNDSFHQAYSARFGWRWSDNGLRIFAYLYNSGIRDSKELGVIEIGTENNCSIKVSGGHYIFELNDHSDTLVRLSTTPKGKGYKLYPYFGGDETAPHDITILIKEIKTD